jgi:exonuclease III
LLRNYGAYNVASKSAFAHDLDRAIEITSRNVRSFVVGGDLNIILKKSVDSSSTYSHGNFDKPIIDVIQKHKLVDTLDICRSKSGPHFTFHRMVSRTPY